MKIMKYEDLLNEKLRVELEALHDERDALNERASQFMQLRTNTELAFRVPKSGWSPPTGR